MKSKLIKIFILMVIFTIGFYGITEGRIFKKKPISKTTLRTGAPVFVEGFVLFNLQKNEINSNITIRDGNRSGRLINNANIVSGNGQLREGSSGNYTGTSNIKYNRKTAVRPVGKITGISRIPGSQSQGPGMQRVNNNNNINLFITTPNRRGISISENFTSGLKIDVSPVYRTGLDVGEPVTVSWNRRARNRGSFELIVTNDRGAVVYKRKNLSGNRFVIPAKKLPPRRTVHIYVRAYEKNLAINGNIASGSVVRLYSEGSFKARTHR
ncbi:MAG: hypothetical protein ABFR75_05980 [Acidobacteriota bacterium]